MRKVPQSSSKDFYLTVGITSLYSVLPFINDARKAYSQFSSDFMWALIFVILLLIIGALSVGIYLGMNNEEKNN